MTAVPAGPYARRMGTVDTYQAIVSKRDQRAFLDRPIDGEAMHRILQAGRMTGSSKNSEPNRLIVVRDRERLRALGALSPLGKFVGYAAAVVVLVQVQDHAFDAGRCAQNMMLAAWAEGIGSCPAHLPEAEVARLLAVPPEIHVNRVIAFGYVDPARAAPPPLVARKRLPLAEIVHEETW